MALVITIASKQYPGSYLRIDGTGVTRSTDGGGGKVDSQASVGPYTKVLIENHPDTNSFSILSNQFPKVYLRMDGTLADPTVRYPKGAGLVNCQYGAGPYEQFRFETQSDGSKAIASVQYPGRYLRLENDSGGGGDVSGSGTVNCQTYIGTLERFYINIF